MWLWEQVTTSNSLPLRQCTCKSDVTFQQFLKITDTHLLSYFESTQRSNVGHMQWDQFSQLLKQLLSH